MGDGKRTFDWMGNMSLQTNRNLHRFLTIDTRPKEEEEEEEVVGKEEEEVELSLGLSLGGRFGTDKGKLVRSSSIAGTFPIVNKSDQDDDDDPPRCRHRTLGRTASLPVETEEEWRKRKEVQTLRRMAAKRRRSEKQKGGGGLTPPALGFARWVLPPHKPVVANQLKVGGDSHQGGGGGSSSGGSESAQGSSSCGGASPASDVAGSSSNTKGKENASNSKRETPPKRHEKVEKRNKERGLNSIEDMPCVFTQGDGPNGRRIEGILYRYGKGEEVSIMCVCHGRFLSPAEFVEHAGIRDVVHPLKHIVVNPSSNSYL